MAALRVPPPCKFFAAGTCTKGSRCRFSHSNASAAAAQVECRYFKLGTCANGDRCRFLHVKGGSGGGAARTKALPRPALVPPQQPKPRTCVIVPPPSSSSHSSSSSSSTSSSPSPLSSSLSSLSAPSASSGYFYGAPGTAPSGTVAPTRAPRVPTANYGKIVAAERAAISRATTAAAATTTPTTIPRCPFYAAGYCRFGDACTKSHEDADATAAAAAAATTVAASASKTCGICMDTVLPKRFGLMMNCDCCFCLDCIRSWRENASGTIATDAVRRCPLCRVPSFFVVPCNRLPFGSEKDKEVANYLAAMKSKRCARFDAGHCPFGASCFYRHVRPDGAVDTSVPRLKTSADGLTSGFQAVRISDFLGHALE